MITEVMFLSSFDKVVLWYSLILSNDKKNIPAPSISWINRKPEKIFKKINSGIYGISGAGFKIGIARNNSYIAVAISGKIGVPGINIDFEVIEVETGFIVTDCDAVVKVEFPLWI